MKKILNVLLSCIGAGGTVFSVITLVSAVRFGELGRVVFYAFTALICIEVAIFAILRLVKNKKK